MEFSGWTPFAIAEQMRDAELRPMGEGRQSAEWDLGVGEVVRAAKEAAGESVSEIEGDQSGVRMQEGFIFETVVEYLIAGLPFDEAVELAFKRYMLSLRTGVVRQIRLVRDFIRCTPDALNPLVPELESYKSTRRSLRNARTAEDFESHFWTWCMAEAAYAYVAGVEQVRFVVWWQAGDYSKGKGTGPQVLEATVRWTAEELERNWRGVVQIADRLRAKGRAE